MFQSELLRLQSLENIRVGLNSSDSMHDRKPYLGDESNYWEIDVMMGSMEGE